MNKHTLNCPFDKKEVAKSAGAIFQSYNKKWVFYGDELPSALATFADKKEEHIEDICNTCHCPFDDEHVIRQSLKNRAWLSTKIRGDVVQECCEACAQECEEAAGYDD